MNSIDLVQSAMTQPSAEYLAKINSMDKSFNDRLKQVYVTSANTVQLLHRNIFFEFFFLLVNLHRLKVI